jgi:hypothetical protein
MQAEWAVASAIARGCARVVPSFGQLTVCLSMLHCAAQAACPGGVSCAADVCVYWLAGARQELKEGVGCSSGVLHEVVVNMADAGTAMRY